MHMLCSAALTGTSCQLSLIRVTLTSQHLHQVLSITAPTLRTGGYVAPSIAGNHPRKPPCFAGCCLVMLPWQKQPALSPGRLHDVLTFVQETELKPSFFFLLLHSESFYSTFSFSAPFWISLSHPQVIPRFFFVFVFVQVYHLQGITATVDLSGNLT